MNNTTLSEIDFLGCKILGVQFNECRRFLLSFRFENCSLRLSVFYNLKLKEACFNKCDLQEADFTETDLTNASFRSATYTGQYSITQIWRKPTSAHQITIPSIQKQTD